MALVTTFTCTTCGKSVNQAVNHERICFSCDAKRAGDKKKAFLNGRAALSIEERLTLLETDIYNANLARTGDSRHC